MSRLISSLNRTAARLGMRFPFRGDSISVPTFDRALYCVLHLLGLMGRETRRILKEMISPGMVCVDIGANIGLYSLEMARLAGPSGKVIAFEPDPLLFRAMEANTGRSKAAPVTALCLAASDREGSDFLANNAWNSGDNHLGADPSAGAEVKVCRLDQVIAEEIDVLKIDVQGWEPLVLRGLAGILGRQKRPIEMLMEFWPAGLARAGFNARDFLDELQAAGWLDLATGEPFKTTPEIESLLETTRFIDLHLRHPCRSSEVS